MPAFYTDEIKILGQTWVNRGRLTKEASIVLKNPILVNYQLII